MLKCEFNSGQGLKSNFSAQTESGAFTVMFKCQSVVFSAACCQLGDIFYWLHVGLSIYQSVCGHRFFANISSIIAVAHTTSEASVYSVYLCVFVRLVTVFFCRGFVLMFLFLPWIQFSCCSANYFSQCLVWPSPFFFFFLFSWTVMNMIEPFGFLSNTIFFQWKLERPSAV